MNNDKMNIADKGTRVGNFIIDSSIIFVLILIQAVILGGMLDVITNDNLPFEGIYFFVFYFFYYFLFEYFFGKTPGKYLTKTIVVNCHGAQPSFKAVLMRSIARLIPYDYFSFIFGQGLHDFISNTIVITGHHKIKAKSSVAET